MLLLSEWDTLIQQFGPKGWKGYESGLDNTNMTNFVSFAIIEPKYAVLRVNSKTYQHCMRPHINTDGFTKKDLFPFIVDTSEMNSFKGYNTFNLLFLMLRYKKCIAHARLLQTTEIWTGIQ